MSDSQASSEDRQLPATQRRLEKAAGQGRVARSRDLGHLSALAASIAAFSWFGATAAEKLIGALRAGLTFSHQQAFDPLQLAGRFAALAGSSFVAMLPIVALIVCAAGLAATLPGGPVWTLHPLRADFSRLSPRAGLGRIASLASLADLGKLASLAVVLCAVGALYLHNVAPQMLHLGRVALDPAILAVAGLVHGAGWSLCAVLLLAACVDVPLQWTRLRNSLRMSHRDLRDEHKETEGDPRIKARIRSLQVQLRRTQMMAAVPKADVVITNPSHYAVAIRYDELGAGAPVVVAKGADHLATRIREIARACDIPAVEAPPLARALYRHVEIDQQIPAALYQAVAQVLAYVYQLRQWRSGKGRPPVEITQIQVPPGLDPNEARA